MTFLCYDEGSIPLVSRFPYHILLFLLRGLVYLKRAGLWVLQRFLWAFDHLASVYRSTIGFWLYKIFFLFKRKVMGAISPQLLTRGVLQVLSLLIGFIFMFPESKAITKEETFIPGRRTVLYQLVGPGEQDFSLEEIIAEEAVIGVPKDERSWRSGTASAQPGILIGGAIEGANNGLVAVSRGGTALTKPTILPGATLPGVSSSQARSEVVFYDVRPGDVIGVIAEQYGVSVASILWANNLTVRSYIRPGDKLKIPPVSGIIHTVKKGDTVAKIAKQYKAKEEDIIIFNRLQPGGADIAIGEELVVPGGQREIVVPVRSRALVNIVAPSGSIEAPAGSGYIWPAGVRRITQYFGLRHTGVDIGGPFGTAIYAARTGVVTRSGCGWNGGYGCYIVIDHGGGVQTAYGHSSQLYVSVGQEVAQGQTISAMGSTGRSTGPHLHFEVRVNGRRQNPLRYIR